MDSKYNVVTGHRCDDGNYVPREQSYVFSFVIIFKMITDNNININNSSSFSPKFVFRWPQHSYLVEHLREEESVQARLCSCLVTQLQDLSIYCEEETTASVSSKIVMAARLSGVGLRNRVWISFDVFMSRNRPGLISDPDNPTIIKKKKKRSKTKKKVTDKENIQNVQTAVYIEEQEDISTIVRAI